MGELRRRRNVCRAFQNSAGHIVADAEFGERKRVDSVKGREPAEAFSAVIRRDICYNIKNPP